MFVTWIPSLPLCIHKRLRVRLTFRRIKRRDKTLIIGERNYNLFFITDIGIINFDTIDNI